MAAPVSSVLRRRDALVVRTHRQTGTFTKPEPGVTCVRALGYEAVDVPLATFRGDVWPEKRALAAAHARLARVTDVDAGVLADVLLVVLSTVTAADAGDVGPVFTAKETPRSHRRTAAHPRGYRGTTYQPPKAAREVVDLRPAIASPAGVREVLARGWTERHEALRRLPMLPADGAARLAGETAPPSDPFATVWLPERVRPSRGFAEDLLWIARGIGRDDVRRLSTLAHLLELEHADELRFALALLLGRHPTATATAWVASVRDQPPARRLAYVTLLLETDVCASVPCPAGLMARVAATASPERYERWCVAMLEGLRDGVDASYLETGIALAGDHAPDHWFRSVAAGELDRRILDAVLARVPHGERSELAICLWRSAGWLPGLDAHLHALRASSHGGKALGRHLCFVADLWWSDRGGYTTVARWRAIEPHLPAIAEMIARAPAAYTDQASYDLGVIVEWWTGPTAIERSLGDAIALVGRLQTPPMSPDGNVANALGVILECPEPAARARMLAAPLEVFVRLDKACRRKNDGGLVAWGLHTLTTSCPELTASAFLDCPGALFRIAKLLGCHRWEARRRLVAAWIDTMPPLPPDDPTVIAVAAAGTGLVPKALREWADGARALTDAQLRGHVRTLQARWPEVRLRSLEAEVRRALGRSVGADVVPPALEFALQMLRESRDNRRGFRRFLRAYLDGDASYLAHHPATRHWLARHPRIDPVRWAEGITTSVTVPDGKRVVLAVEQDPLEVLRMGTYVGSCLGLGGLLSESAVAVLLDVNKAVVYARDASGAVLGRQLVAISEADELVAFTVYPKAAPWLAAAFRQYDARLAEHLGVALCRSGNYEVAEVLSSFWWDDGRWDDGRWDDAAPRASASAGGRRRPVPVSTPRARLIDERSE